jgi:ABC-type multidrug transport system ATPase subunit
MTEIQTKMKEQTTVVMFETGPEKSDEFYLTWSDLSIGVTLAEKPKGLIRSMNGSVQSGEVIAILGGSGAGKTTLLNSLAGKLDGSYSISGSVLFNGAERNEKEWRRVCGYVEQDDVFHPYLTVQETLDFQADLRLPMNADQRKARVQEVLMDLGLDHCRSTRVGNADVRGISGGERKRLSIGQELLTAPQILFLDEPTSGLDAFTALNLIETLRQLAKKNNKCIVMTIHQPRTELLEKFDKLMLLSDGRTLFFGGLEEALSHFAGLGYPIPKNTNPSDFFLDTLTLDRRNAESLAESEGRINQCYEAWKKIEPPVPFVKQRASTVNYETGSSAVKFLTLYKRDIMLLYRDRPHLTAIFAETAIMVTLLGSLFYNSINDPAGIQNKIGVLFFLALDIPFTCIMPLTVVFPSERSITKRERSSGAYFSWTAYLSKFFAHVPLLTFNALLLSMPIYLLVNLRRDTMSILRFIITIIVHALNSSSLGLLIGAAIPNVSVGQTVGPLVITLFLLFGGPILNVDSLSWVFRWLQYISSVAYANKGMVQNEFLNATTTCVEGRVCYETGDMVVETFSLKSPRFWESLVLNFALMVGFLLVGLIVYHRTSSPVMRLK